MSYKAWNNHKYREGVESRKEIYLYIVRYIKEHGYSPSMINIADDLGIHKNNVQKHMRELEMSNLIATEHPGESRAYRVVGYEYTQRKKKVHAHE